MPAHPQPPSQSLRASKKEDALDARLRALCDQITSDAYNYVTTGLFEAHKLLFSFQLAVKVLEGAPGAPDPQFLDFFLKGNMSLERHPRARPHEWLPDQGWQDVMAISELAAAKRAEGVRLAGGGLVRLGSRAQRRPCLLWSKSLIPGCKCALT